MQAGADRDDGFGQPWTRQRRRPAWSAGPCHRAHHRSGTGDHDVGSTQRRAQPTDRCRRWSRHRRWQASRQSRPATRRASPRRATRHWPCRARSAGRRVGWNAPASVDRCRVRSRRPERRRPAPLPRHRHDRAADAKESAPRAVRSRRTPRAPRPSCRAASSRSCAPDGRRTRGQWLAAVPPTAARDATAGRPPRTQRRTRRRRTEPPRHAIRHPHTTRRPRSHRCCRRRSPPAPRR